MRAGKYGIGESELRFSHHFWFSRPSATSERPTTGQRGGLSRNTPLLTWGGRRRKKNIFGFDKWRREPEVERFLTVGRSAILFFRPFFSRIFIFFYRRFFNLFICFFSLSLHPAPWRRLTSTVRFQVVLE